MNYDVEIIKIQWSDTAPSGLNRKIGDVFITVSKGGSVFDTKVPILYNAIDLMPIQISFKRSFMPVAITVGRQFKWMVEQGIIIALIYHEIGHLHSFLNNGPTHGRVYAEERRADEYAASRLGAIRVIEMLRVLTAIAPILTDSGAELLFRAADLGSQKAKAIIKDLELSRPE